MQFEVKFDTSIANLPAPKPPFVGSGYFGFNGGPDAPPLPDGSYKFKDLTDVYFGFVFNPSPSTFNESLNFYVNYIDPPDNSVLLYDPDSLYVEIYDAGKSFYFNGPTNNTYGNVGSLDLNMYSSYITANYPNFQAPIFLSFQPNNPLVPPGGSAPPPPYNRYGLFAKLSSTPPGGNPNLIYNGIYGTVPGPLPILAVGTSFAWSRRLRRRIGKST